MGSIDFHRNWREGGRREDAPSVRIIEVLGKDGSSVSRGRLLVERTETRVDRGAGRGGRAEITLRYVSLDESFGGFNNHRFCAWCDWLPNGEATVCLTGGAVMLTSSGRIPRGAHIGTYLFDEIVRWAQQWPDAEVKPIGLGEGDATDENRERRNAFYEQFGITFDYSSEGRRAGRSRPMVAGDLTPVDPQIWMQDIEETGLVDYLRKSIEIGERLTGQNECLRQTARGHWELIETMRDSPVTWACRAIFARYQAGFFALIALGAVGFGVWRMWL